MNVMVFIGSIAFVVRFFLFCFQRFSFKIERGNYLFLTLQQYISRDTNSYLPSLLSFSLAKSKENSLSPRRMSSLWTDRWCLCVSVCMWCICNICLMSFVHSSLTFHENWFCGKLLWLDVFQVGTPNPYFQVRDSYIQLVFDSAKWLVKISTRVVKYTTSYSKEQLRKQNNWSSNSIIYH